MIMKLSDFSSATIPTYPFAYCILILALYFFFIMVEPSTPGLHTIQTVTLGVYIELSKVIASFSFSFARKRLP